MVLALVLCHVALALALSPRAPRAAPRRGGATNAAGASDGDDSDYRRRAAPDERSAPRRGADDRGAPRRGSDDRGAPRRGYDDRSAPRRGSDDRGSPRRGPDDRRRESDDRGAPRRGPDDRGAPRRDDRGAPRRGPPPPRESWAVRRLSGDSAASQARNGRAKKWETRGDALYQASTGDAFAGLVGAELEAAAEAMLLGLAAPPRPLDDDDEDAVAEAIPSTVAWGGVSVGPVLLPRLLAAQIMQPTPIQRAAFDVIARGDAALIVSETGSGKTLAFLVPLLARLPRSTPFQALLVCPSAEVAQQTQRAVDALWPPDAAGSAVHVAADADALEALALRPAPLIAGTPAALHALLKAAKAQSADERRKDVWHVGASDMDASVSSLLMKNLRAVVVDEVDQLLDTAAHAAFALDTRKAQPKLTACEALLRSLPWPKAHEGKVGLQLICASASVGRVLRRQLQQITGAASVDAAAALVTAGARRGTCPETLDHVAALWGSAAGSAEAGEGDRVEAVADAIFAAMAHLPPRATIVFATKSLGSTARIADALKKRGLGDVSTLGSRKPAAFDDDYDGAEVADLKALLRERKLSNVGGKLVLVDRLRKSDAAPSDDLEAATDVDADAYAAFKVPELKDLLRARELKVSGGTKADLCARLVQDDRRAAAAAAGATPLALGEAAVQASWASTPVFVANDKCSPRLQFRKPATWHRGSSRERHDRGSMGVGG